MNSGSGLQRFWRWVQENEKRRAAPIWGRVGLGLLIGLVVFCAGITSNNPAPLWIVIPMALIWPLFVVLGVWNEWREGWWRR